MDKIIKICTVLSKKIYVGHLQLRGVNIGEGAFADDVVLMARNEGELQESVEV